MPAWARLVSAVAALRVAVGLTLYLAGWVDAANATPVPLWAYAAFSLTFGALGATLVVVSGDDPRAAWLGGILLLIASPLTANLMRGSAPPFLGYVRPDAFLPAFVWRFLLDFPSRLEGRARRLASGTARACVALGLFLAAANLSLFLRPAGEALWRRPFIAGQSPDSYYWPMLFLPSAAAFAAMITRMLTSSGADQTRVRIFVGGLAAGMLPLFVEVLVEESWPAYKSLAHQPGVEPWIGSIIFGALAIVPFVTAYSVIFDRVVETRVVVHAALQYLLARYTIATAAVLPFVALGLYFFQHRAEPLVALLTGPRPVVLIAAVTAGVAMARRRQRWRDALDRRFFREPYDPQLLLTRVISDEVISSSPATIADRLTVEVERALHARIDLFLADDAAGVLRDARGERPPIGLNSALVTLALADMQPMDVSLGEFPIERLPQSERDWIASGGYRLLAPVRTRPGVPVALMALGAKRSGLPYSSADRQLITTVAAPLALALENERLRHTPEPASDSPALECSGCGRMYPSDARQCPCGGALVQGRAPYLLRGVFRVERRIGAGGMGIVYRAVDLELARDVAIKTLPRVTAEHVSRLRREAQTMASVVHSNLAVVYGIETWRGVPFLIQEYLTGGTLAARLRAGRLSVAEVIELGIAVAGVLEYLHTVGIVHCDIKPSNIGFSQNGVVKLLDFGLAYLLRGSDAVASTTTVGDEKLQGETDLIVTARGLMGTPPYMSPEAIHAGRPTPAFDFWALAVVLYEALAGRRPFQGRGSDEVFDRIERGDFPDVRTLREDCPAPVADFFNRAFAADPGLRPSDARTFTRALSALR